MTSISEEEIVSKIKSHFDSRASQKKSATSPDYNLREVEIQHITKHLSDNKQILDLGCGNGYSTLMYASRFKSDFLGIDYSKPMIDSAKKLSKKFNYKGNVNFEVSDVLNPDLRESFFDIAITQRLLINLASEKNQIKVISNIHKALKPNGRYFMCEGTLQGHRRLNKLRKEAGLDEIPNTSNSNIWSLKLDETKIHRYIKDKFMVETIVPFGMYFFISRIIHPLLVYPKNPKYNAKINHIAADLESIFNNKFLDVGHQRLYILTKI